MNYHIITYGCQMNKSDSKKIGAFLEKKGYQAASKINEADLVLVNMCSVRQSAVDRIFGLANELEKIKSTPCAKKIKTALTGCVLKRDRDKFKKFFDLILDIKDLQNWHKQITAHQPSPIKIRLDSEKNFSALVPISHGCNNFCSYCVVPFTRGRLICRSTEDILKEVKKMVKKRVKEIWLLGQNVNDYEDPGNHSTIFAKLLKMVDEIPGDFWVRFTSPNPADFSDELIEIMAKCEKITPYLNLPVQSGNDEILRKMKRPYNVKRYKSLVKKIRRAFKKYRRGEENKIALSTDAIVGFPGETKKEFENTKKLFSEIKFDMAYIAKYSPRPGTTAFLLKDDVSQKEKQKRWKDLTKILKETSLYNNKKYIKKEVEVLVENLKNGFLFGKSRHYKTVKFEGAENLVGKFVKVKIINALSWGLKGKLKAEMKNL